MKSITRFIPVVVLTFATIVGSQEIGPSSEQPAKVEVYLYADRSRYRPGESIHVRIELKNISDHPILVGREISSIGNWPFSIWLRLVDSKGKYAQPTHGAYVDPPPRTDLSVREGVLRWWTTLDPGYFYGKEVDFQLEALKEGHYELEGDYYSIGLVGEPTASTANGGQTPALAGKMRAHAVAIEVYQPD
jgi:hypothetical protein